MFNPLDFLDLANELQHSPGDQAKIRASSGRSYYDAYLHARE